MCKWAFLSIVVSVCGLGSSLHAQELKLRNTLATTDGAEIISAFFSPDGGTLAIMPTLPSKPVGGSIRLWDLTTAKCIELKGVIGVRAFSADGKTLIAWSGNHFSHQFTVYDVASGKVTGTFKKKSEAPLAFSPDGRYLAYRGHGGIALIELAAAWDPDSGKNIANITESSRHCFFSPDGKTLLAGSSLLDVTAGKLKVTLDGPPTSTWLYFSPDGKSFATPHAYQIRLWSATTGKVISILGNRIGKNHPEFVAFSPDGKSLASIDAGGSVKLWDVASGKNVASGSVPGRGLAFSPDLKTLATVGKNGSIELWDIPGVPPAKK